MESVGPFWLDRFGWSQSWSWSRLNIADSDTGPESQATICPQAIILVERLSITPETLKHRKKKIVAVCR